ncbi:PD-(D/E)XK nuclease family protein [Candidatus Methanodesulfokora washburnensis]|jgi:CRISPR/Cas system-associated exonuclease Cas4 (RecB family)|uniref:PD-(D/E)XK endonuclease-like domain-containing protein n=1 Tax=Candidatus Methanodesulfokora washburnensis TaxID=2478471 RepID=A0A3R9RKS9_9CREN|nr:PD-(D/E)XK nuclease family protein [Candidatus Methanodesulfokores washburnensis]RSN72490.1 hypothetical protein D6D85_13655 [Candidatus Methanodesulfokores washburnensis]
MTIREGISKGSDLVERAISFSRRFGRIEGVDPEPIIRWAVKIGGIIDKVCFSWLIWEKRKRKSLCKPCFLGVKSLVDWNFCPRKTFLDTTNESGYYMRYIDIKGNFLLIRGDLNDKERGLVKCILYFINDVADGIAAVPAMREDKGQEFMRGLKNVLGWIDKNYPSPKDFIGALLDAVRKISEFPDLTQDDFELLLKEEKKKERGGSLTDEEIKLLAEAWSENEDQERGWISEHRFAEDYPTIGLYKAWGNHVIVGVPDGIADSFIYEYKDTRSEKNLKYVVRDASLQADIYSVLLPRRKKRIHIHIAETGDMRIIEEETNPEKAKEHVDMVLKAIDEGEIPQKPSGKRCSVCSDREICDRAIAKIVREWQISEKENLTSKVTERYS